MSERNADRPAEAETDVPVLIPAVGEQLRAAREQAGLQVKDVAQSLKLGARQVDALENGDWAGLPGATFIRGSVRNYARLLALDPAPLMAQLDAVVERPKTVLTVPRATATQMPYASGGRRDRNVVLIGLAAVLLAGLAYFLLPNNLYALREEMQSIIDSLSRKEEPVTPPASPATASEPVFPPGTTPQQIMTPPTLQAETAPAPVAPLQDRTAAPANAELGFVLSRDSWIEVRDRDDRVVFSQRLQAGAQQAVAGQGPLSVVIGYAPGVKLQWRGQPIDLEPHTRGDVARLVLE